MPFNTTDKAPFTPGCDLRAIFGRPETYEDAQTQKVLFLCNCCSTTVVPSLNHQNCCIGTARSHKGVWVDAEPLSWWLKGCRGRRMEAQWSPQWSLNGGHWSAKGGTMVVQGRQRYRSNWYTMFTTVRIFTGDECPTPVNPFCNNGDASCLLWVTCERPTPLATVLNMLKTSRCPWCPWRGLNVLCTTLERPGQTFGLLCAFNGDLASFVVAQGRHKGRSPCV